MCENRKRAHGAEKAFSELRKFSIFRYGKFDQLKHSNRYEAGFSSAVSGNNQLTSNLLEIQGTHRQSKIHYQSNFLTMSAVRRRIQAFLHKKF